MPRCSSCNQFTDDPVVEEDGRTQNVLCRMCAAEKDLKLGQLSLEDLTKPRPVSVMDRLKRFWRNLFG